ncbi:MAG: neutral/alkaline non-lysosomal ceramidase N-terminal domain-containing protein [Candidatus Latescibacteria bacterium]|nr:neutral/alkaline non-lysosomal ceramidase N-terminal domain-containing protein [Candidatus Latescibacterota bacterium]
MKAGVAKVNITPPVGAELSGYVGRQQPSVGIHDELYASALVLDDGHQRAAIVACDLVGLTRDSVETVRGLISQNTEMPGANVMVCCTHTHSGPATLRLRNCGKIDETWMSVLYQQLAGAVIWAEKNLKEVRAGFGQGTVVVGINRRAASIQNKDAIVDSTLGVLKIEDLNENPVAALLNYPCHGVVLSHENRLVSADFPGAAVRFVERNLPGNPITLYTNGACGDINPYLQGNSFKQVERIGTIVGAESVKIIACTETTPNLDLAVASRNIELPLQKMTKEQIEAQFQHYSHQYYSEGLDWPYINRKIYEAMEQWAQETIELLEAGTLPNTVSTEVQVIRIGELYLVAVPGEAFCQIGLAIKKRSPGRTLVIGYANDVVGYIPTKETFTEGGYEVEEAYKYYSNLMLAPESAQILVETATNLMNSLKVK